MMRVIGMFWIMSEDQKPDELKSERVQLLMTPSEVKAIDDWGFENRIRTRAEAIRRLCQIALAFDAEGPALFELVTKRLSSNNEFMKYLIDIPKNPENRNNHIQKIVYELVEQFKYSDDLKDILRNLDVILTFHKHSQKDGEENYEPPPYDEMKAALAEVWNKQEGQLTEDTPPELES